MGIIVWLLFGLGAALGDSGADVVTKRFFTQLQPYGMALARLLGAIPFLLLASLFIIRMPPLTPPFWKIVACMVPLEIVAMLLYMRSLKVCHLSLCIPFLAFTPVLLIFSGWLLLGESLGAWGIVGTLLIAAGSYILGLGVGAGRRAGFLAPARALASESGARFMLVVAILYAFTAALYKLAILHSGPVFFGVIYPFLYGTVLMAGYPLKRVQIRPLLGLHFGWWLVLGFFFALSNLSLANGMELAPATYVIAVKRISLLLSVVMGGLWLKERPFLPRFLGSGLMFSGIVLIAFRG